MSLSKLISKLRHTGNSSTDCKITNAQNYKWSFRFINFSLISNHFDFCIECHSSSSFPAPSFWEVKVWSRSCLTSQNPFVSSWAGQSLQLNSFDTSFFCGIERVNCGYWQDPVHLYQTRLKLKRSFPPVLLIVNFLSERQNK